MVVICHHNQVLQSGHCLPFDWNTIETLNVGPLQHFSLFVILFICNFYFECCMFVCLPFVTPLPWWGTIGMMTICLFVCPSVHPSVRPSVCPSICPSDNLDNMITSLTLHIIFPNIYQRCIPSWPRLSLKTSDLHLFSRSQCNILFSDETWVV